MRHCNYLHNWTHLSWRIHFQVHFKIPMYICCNLSKEYVKIGGMLTDCFPNNYVSSRQRGKTTKITQLRKPGAKCPQDRLHEISSLANYLLQSCFYLPKASYKKPGSLPVEGRPVSRHAKLLKIASDEESLLI